MKQEAKLEAKQEPEMSASEKKQQAEAEKAAGKTLTPEEKKAQRDAANKAKAEKKALAAAKKLGKITDDEPVGEAKQDQGKKKQPPVEAKTMSK